MIEVRKMMEEFGEALITAANNDKSVNVIIDNGIVTTRMTYAPDDVMVYADYIECSNQYDEIEIDLSNMNRITEFLCSDNGDEGNYSVEFKVDDTMQCGFYIN